VKPYAASGKGRLVRVHTSFTGYTIAVLKVLMPIGVGVFGAVRHLAWYVSYQVTGEPR
jgi:hypothetical protein